ncbi:5-formyltetrahydrofolate cyclo-ligase [Pseudomonas amygdali pv. myricae]|nr:5-formyltetrahydrofolate cyclo-ligase [Pseudomonas amygdali pv. myricae]
MFEAEVGSLDVAFSATAVKALALELVGQYVAFCSLLHQGVGDLDLPTLAWLSLFDLLENVRSQDVAADDRQVGRRIFRLRFFNHVGHAKQARLDFFTGDHAILVGFLRIDFLNGNDRAAIMLMQFDHLRQHAITIRIYAQVIRQNHGECFITNQRTTAENGMTQTFHFSLASVGKAALVDQFANTNQVLFLVRALDLMLKLVADIKVIFKSTLATTGHDGNFGQACREGFLNTVLDQWLVDHRQHFLGHGLGRWQEASAVTGCWEQAFLDHKSPW